MEGKRLVLHAGCGPLHVDPEVFPPEDWEEVRLDCNPSCEPDIVGRIEDLDDIGPFDAVYSAHTVEHLPLNLAITALSEFRRVLKPGGFALVVVPDLEDVTLSMGVMYEVNGVGITAHDMIYGDTSQTADNPAMQHRCGFNAEFLGECLQKAGFSYAYVKRASGYNLIGTAIR